MTAFQRLSDDRLELVVDLDGQERHFWATRVPSEVGPLIQLDDGFHRSLGDEETAYPRMLAASRKLFHGEELAVPYLLTE